MTTETPPKKSRLKSGCLIAVGVLVGLTVLGAIIGDPDADKAGTAVATDDTPAASPSPSPTITRVVATPAEIFDAYQDNQIAAAKRFEDQPLSVSGTVQKVDESFGSPVIRLLTSNEFMSLGAEFDKADGDVLASLHTGDKVTVNCDKLSEAAGFLTMSECTLAN